MPEYKFRLFEAAMIGVLWPFLWSLMHLLEGARPLVTELEIGAIMAGVWLRLFDTANAYSRSKANAG